MKLCGFQRGLGEGEGEGNIYFEMSCEGAQ